jgi:hypothetical protein
MLFNVGAAGAWLSSSRSSCSCEETANNAITRLVNVDSDRRRVLYVEGEPRRGYVFVRRAEEDDRIVQLVTMVTTGERDLIVRASRTIELAMASDAAGRSLRLSGHRHRPVATYFTASQRVDPRVRDRRGGDSCPGRSGSLADGGGRFRSASLLPIVP